MTDLKIGRPGPLGERVVWLAGQRFETLRVRCARGEIGNRVDGGRIAAIGNSFMTALRDNGTVTMEEIR